MTCPAGWREAAVRRYVEAEFSGVGARVFRAYVHPPPPGAAPCTPAVADVYLNFSMGRPRLGEAVRAMLAAPPRAVEDGAGGSVLIRFSPGAADVFGGGGTTNAATATVKAAQLPLPQASVGSSSPRSFGQQVSPGPSAPLASSGSPSAVGTGANIARGHFPAVDDAVEGVANLPPVLAALVVDLGNRSSMTCPKGWSEDSVRQYVEAEFSGVGARVHGSQVHRSPSDASPCVSATADVYLDCHMAKPQLLEATVAMLTADPKTVDDGAGGSAIISFGPTVRF